MNQELTDFIRQKSAATFIDWEERKQVYIQAVYCLYDQVEQLLSEAIQQNSVLRTRRPIKLVELSIGEYFLDELILNIGASTVRFLPKGRNIAGAEGRVDLIGGQASVTLILENNKWLLVDSKIPRLITSEFNEATFIRALKQIMGE